MAFIHTKQLEAKEDILINLDNVRSIAKGYPSKISKNRLVFTFVDGGNIVIFFESKEKADNAYNTLLNLLNVLPHTINKFNK